MGLPGELSSDVRFPVPSLAVAIPAIGAQYSMFQAAPAPKMIEDGKIHTMEHMISPIAVQPDPAAAAAVIPAVSTPPPFQVECLLGSSTSNIRVGGLPLSWIHFPAGGRIRCVPSSLMKHGMG